MPHLGNDPVAERPAAAAATSASAMSPCGGECRVGRTLLRGGPSSPARGADPRRPQHRPFATNKRDRPAGCASCATRLCGALCGGGRPPRGGRRRSFVGGDRMPIALHGLALGKAKFGSGPIPFSRNSVGGGRRLMTTPGVGPVVSLTYRATV